MSNDTKAIIGTIVAVNVSLGGLLSVQFAGVNTRIDDLRTEIATVKADLSADNADIRTDLRRMDDRLRAVEIAFGKVDPSASRPWSGSTGRPAHQRAEDRHDRPAPVARSRRDVSYHLRLAVRPPKQTGSANCTATAVRALPPPHPAG